MTSILSRTTVVIPFRLASDRFPRKALSGFRGRTLLEHAVHNGLALGSRDVVVTAPADDLREAADRIDLRCVRMLPSSAAAGCATDRVVEIHEQLGGEYLMSLPIDEPAIYPSEIVRALSPGPRVFDDAGAVTFYCAFASDADVVSPLSAKVVLDRRGTLLYMSRAAIPLNKDGSFTRGDLKKNVGAFVFTRAFLQVLADGAAVPTHLDAAEGLEQLRWLELGLRVRCLPVHHIGFGIDVPTQLQLLEERLACS